MFFGYFLNIKKVTPSADFVIAPAKAGAFLFSHTRLPFPPRPLLPFGRISPAAKPRVRSSAPPFGFAAQKRARHFATHSLGGRPLRGHGFATPHRYFAVPVTSAPRRGPNGKTPALPPFRLRTSSFSAHFSAQKCPRRAMLSHSSRRGRPFALFHRAGAAFGTLTAAAAPPPSWSRRPLHIPCPPF